MIIQLPRPAILIGCAGWSLPKQHLAAFPAEGTHLARYASRLPAVEINSSFYRPHQPATYAKWAAAVPDDFRFAVKVPKEITHQLRLVNVESALDRFLSEVTRLEHKLGPLLIQLPPSFRFAPDVAEKFLVNLRQRCQSLVAIEPRHASWFESEAEELLKAYHVARVAADPAIVPAAAIPGGCAELAYYRLHGSPRVYYSGYAATFLEGLSNSLSATPARSTWCIFDNTAEGEAVANALDLRTRIERDNGAGDSAIN